ncbi:MAG TPA: hypothetical protein VL127_06245 [Bryobacteraceae bacterium]|jgi:hypothetical protein|nr:hypothetical protein [Bryobacteraceae bacterium]
MRLLEILIMTLAGVWQGVRQDFNLLEVALIAVGWWAWKRGWRPRYPAWLGIPQVWLRYPALTALGLAGGAIALRLALIPVLPVPFPLVSDEFSHLLLADTLAHGRLANPTPEFWPHFESLHILQQPHYVSNYFPGQALLLAAGQVALNSPWAGVLAGCACFLLALYWALRGWMPARWALFGVLLAALRFAVASYWVNAYHGGFVPAAGGALVLGAYARLHRRASVAGGAALGLGLAILAVTRPFEGVAYATPLLALLAWQYRARLAALLRIAAPALLITGAALAGLGVYLKAVTGSPFVTAYQISQKTYGWPMALAWTPPPRIHNRHIEMANYYDYEVGEHEKVADPVNIIEYFTLKIEEYWRFFFGPVLTIPLIMLGRVWQRRKMLFAGLAGAFAAILLEGAASPHYLAPAAAVLIAILVECCRHLQGARIRILPLLPAVMALVLALRIGAEQAGLSYTQELNFQTWCCRVEGNRNKPRIMAELAKTPGNHLVFIKAKTDTHNLFQWIYNDADIEGSRFVWARDLGDAENARLAASMAGRRVWMVDPNVEPAALTAYDPAALDMPAMPKTALQSRRQPLPPGPR